MSTKITGKITYWDRTLGDQVETFDQFWKAESRFEDLLKDGRAYNINLVQVVTQETVIEKRFERNIPVMLRDEARKQKAGHYRLAEEPVIYCPLSGQFTEFGTYHGDEEPASDYCGDCRMLMDVKSDLEVAHHIYLDNEWFCHGEGFRYVKTFGVCPECKEGVS